MFFGRGSYFYSEGEADEFHFNKGPFCCLLDSSAQCILGDPQKVLHDTLALHWAAFTAFACLLCISEALVICSPALNMLNCVSDCCWHFYQIFSSCRCQHVVTVGPLTSRLWTESVELHLLCGLMFLAPKLIFNFSMIISQHILYIRLFFYCTFKTLRWYANDVCSDWLSLQQCF